MKFKKEELERSIPERFEKIAHRYPDRIAVKTHEEVLTYRELNGRANRLSRAVRAREDHAAEPVGLFFETGIGLAAAMLGVLKAGRFFTLLDPSLPRARNAAMLENSGARLVITNRKHATRLAEIQNPGMRRLELESIDFAADAENLELPIEPAALACIVYTSGSTGEPKGVVSDHRHLLHHAMVRTRNNRADARDRISLLSSGTPNAVTDTFFALLNGAALLPFHVREQGVSRLAGWLVEERVSICAMASPLFRIFCEALNGSEQFPDLRLLRLRSDTVYKSDVDLYRKYFPSTCAFMTGLSSGEAGLLTTYSISDQARIVTDEVPVGYAVEDKQIILLDEAGREVGFNRVGEIAVGSRYLSPGYWRRPDLTREKFKPGPQGGDARLYLTGDLGLMLPDGCLLLKGRKDFRVKVRGYGVEISEIEKALRTHPAIRDAVVSAREEGSGETRLVAHFTSNQPPPSIGELRGFLRNRLPDYMVPSAFVKLDSMPLTINGKLDRRALPAPNRARPEIDVPFAPPGNSAEKRLAKIWSGILGFDPIGIHDNFFDSGGHSLSASRVIARIREEFQVQLPLHRLFDAPTIAALAGCLETIPSSGRETEAGLLQAPATNEPCPLSFGQRRLWFLDRLAPDSPAYNLLFAYSMTGSVNVAALEHSINEVVRRHEVLRTIFAERNGEPYQVVLPSATIRIAIADIGARELQTVMAAEAKRPFDLARGPLLRVTLLRRKPDEHLLLLVAHHIVADGWSENLLACEISALYNAFSYNEPSSLEELSSQYADFTRWQRGALGEEALQRLLAYWEKQLAGMSVLQLPADHPPPVLRSFRGARQRLAFSEELTASLKTLSRFEGVSLFMTLLAAFQTLLHRYTGENDIAIGSPVAGRSRREVEVLIGFFLNTLVLRTDLSGNPTFRGLLARVRTTCLGAYSHQDLPFEALVENLQPERRLNDNPLFQVTFTLNNTPAHRLQLDGLKVDKFDADPGIARFDLHLSMEEDDPALRGYLNYRTDLFHPATISRMVDHFQVLLEDIVANPDRRLSDLSILTPMERRQLLATWNDTNRDYPKHRCIHELFEAQAEQSPDAVAVSFEDQQVTYREINGRANQLANHLRSLGVGPEVLVGICMERSPQMVIGLLGILKAGGAYMPLDPEYPGERLAFMLHDARALVLLTQRRLADRLIEDEPSKTEDRDPRSGIHAPQFKVVCLDEDWPVIAARNQQTPCVAISADNLAYVIYTSGSTGKPKGVAVAHRSTAALLHWAAENFSLQETAGVLASTSVCFDLSIFELFLPLSRGGTVVLVRNILDLPALGSAGEVTLVNTVPSAMAELMRTTGLPASVRAVCLAGEPLPAQLVRRIYRQQTVQKVFDLYGPSEDTTYSTFALRSATGPATIGRPIANTRVYLLDCHLNPVPIGVPGELHIGGAGLARGYLNRPELTAEKFIPHPFSAEPGARLYRTGDLARYLPDGNIEFLGRTDHQIKIRGYRIEPGEIESVLARHPAVREAVVLARDEASDGKRLVGYVVRGEPVQTADLRNFLKRKLPDYMIPSEFAFLDSLPLTSSGKIDRRALPEPDRSRPELQSAFVAPRTPIEESLARIWTEVLKLEKIGVHDNFFDLGGHSLLATQVISRLRNAFQLDLSLRSLFEAPTIAGLAAQVAEAGAKSAATELTASVLAELDSFSDEQAQLLLSRDRSKTF